MSEAPEYAIGPRSNVKTAPVGSSCGWLSIPSSAPSPTWS